jgi:prepilin-type N-terminal cleavage/methylation domain-containing protein
VEQLMRRTLETTRGKARAGLTLIEVMIALTILAVGLLTVAAMQLEALRSGRSGASDTFASALAQDEMEELQRMSWANADLAATGNWVTAQTVTHPVNGQSYLVDWRVNDLVTDWTRTVDVRVRWDGPKRANRSRILSSIRYNREAL